MYNFGTLSQVSADDPSTWANRLFVTLDVDWCSDEVLQYCIDLLSELKIKATWFYTHQTPLLGKILQTNGSELGAHPNFNHLLNSSRPGSGSSSREIIKSLKEIAPEVRVVRSHSLAYSQYIGLELIDEGYTHISNYLIPCTNKIEIRPFRVHGKLTELPMIWMDTTHWAESWNCTPSDVLDHPGLKVLCFHPIHLFLNTEDMARYRKALLAKSFSEIKELRYQGYGSESFLREVVQLASAHGSHR